MSARLTAALASIVLVGAIAAFSVPDGPEISGQATVVDGDTLRIGSERVRLAGVDAPELSQTCDGQPCGQAARVALQRFIGGDVVSCYGNERDRYGRLVAICSTRSVPDLGKLLVGTGNAIDYTKYSKGRYKDAEDAARSERLGIWSGHFVPPETFRRNR